VRRGRRGRGGSTHERPSLMCPLLGWLLHRCSSGACAR
jgi:hypothetical protein